MLKIMKHKISAKKLSDALFEISKENKNIQIQKLDATSKTEVENFCSNINEIDILFHAVGFVHHGKIMDCDTE